MLKGSKPKIFVLRNYLWNKLYVQCVDFLPYPNNGFIKHQEWQASEVKSGVLVWQGLASTKTETVDRNRCDPSLRPLSGQCFSKEESFKVKSSQMDLVPFVVLRVPDPFSALSNTVCWDVKHLVSWQWLWNLYGDLLGNSHFVVFSREQTVFFSLKFPKDFVCFLKCLCSLICHLWTAMVLVSSSFV